jgi:hypothetical protein
MKGEKSPFEKQKPKGENLLSKTKTERRKSPFQNKNRKEIK